MKNKIFLCLATFILFFSGGGNVFALSVSATEETIYAMDSVYSENTKIPTDFLKQWQIKVDDNKNVSYKVKSGNSAIVDTNGLVKPKSKIYYCTKSYCTTNEISDYISTKTVYEGGDTVIEVSSASEKIDVVVHVVKYEVYNAQKIMNNHVKNNITSSMTDKEKMEKILELISQTNYSVNYSDYVGLFSGDGGDCLASTDAIIYMANLVGIKAHGRDARRDVGAGSNHYNVAALLDGKVYVVEGGYNEPSPRNTSIFLTTLGFSTGSGNYATINSKFIQYDGYDEYVVVPEDTTITKLGTFAFYYGSHKDTKVSTAYVSKSINEIGSGAFSRVNSLNNILVDDNNNYFKSIDGILYSKDGILLHSYPSGKNSNNFVIPNNVEEINEYAFSYNHNLTRVIFPDSLKIIGNRAFYGSKIRGIIIPSNVTSIGNEAFSWDSIQDVDNSLNYMVVLNPNAELGNNLCSSFSPMYGYENSTAQEYAETHKCNFGVINEGQKEFKDIKELSVEIPSIEYEENNNIPEVIIKDGSYTLVKDVDYKLECSNNTYPTSYANAKIMGIGDYVGYRVDNYSIEEKEIHYIYTNPVVTYNGKAQSPIIEVENSDDLTIQYGDTIYSNLSTELRKYTNPGVYKFGVRITGTDYKSLYLEDLTFTIKGIDIADAIVSDIPNYPYFGSIVNPPVDIKLDGKNLVKDVDYTYSISNNYNSGTATIIITGKGIYEGTIVKTFDIVNDYELKMKKENITISLGSSYNLDLYTEPNLYFLSKYATWTSLNNDVVMVDSEGKVTAKGLGSTKVKAVFRDKVVYCDVEVVNYMKGDMNKDGNINLTDVIILLKKYLGISDIFNDDIVIGDMNNNSKIDLTDVIILLKQYLKM